VELFVDGDFGDTLEALNKPGVFMQGKYSGAFGKLSVLYQKNYKIGF
jgi:hypothetical protein